MENSVEGLKHIEESGVKTQHSLPWDPWLCALVDQVSHWSGKWSGSLETHINVSARKTSRREVAGGWSARKLNSCCNEQEQAFPFLS